MNKDGVPPLSVAEDRIQNAIRDAGGGAFLILTFGSLMGLRDNTMMTNMVSTLSTFNPVCFHLGARPIYWYGIMVALAFLAGVLHLTWLARKTGRPETAGSDIGFWLMLSGVIGGRVAYIMANYRDYLADPWTIIRVDQGGLIFYGGFIGAMMAGIIYSRVKREPFLVFSDYVITALPLAHALGRLGCFLNGCCYGSITLLPWRVFVNGTPRHPVQLYEALLGLMVYGVLLWAYGRVKIPGRVLAVYLMLYPVGRFIVEFWRGDPRQHGFGLTVAQNISLVLFAAGVALWFLAPVFARHGRTKPVAG